MAETPKIYKSTRVLLASGLTEAAILVREGKIAMILKNPAEIKKLSTKDLIVEDFGDLVLMPGIVDSHVHVNEPGRVEWEGFVTATKAAAAGGVTTIADMPLNSIPPTTNVANLATKLAAAEGKMHVDVAFWGGLIPGNQSKLRPMIEQGVVGFKCFLCPSGVPEFPHVVKKDIEKALVELKDTGSVLAFHAEMAPSEKEAAPPPPPKATNPHKYATFLESRQPQMEEDAVSMITSLCAEYEVRCHIVHLSSAGSLPMVKSAKYEGVPLTVETCFHYLTITAEEVPDRAVEFKCCPPIRAKENKEALWTALVDWDIDMVVSDHSPCTLELKRPGNSSDFMKAWGGISSLQFGLALFWTGGRRRGFKIPDVSRLLSENTAALLGLEKRKGRLALGYDADFVVWDPDANYTVTADMIHHKNKVCPYIGRTLQGVVVATVVRGVSVFRAGETFPSASGKVVLKTR